MSRVELSDIFLELANGNKLQILLFLEHAPLRLTALSKRLQLSMPETSRHLSRLMETKLIRREIDGYHLTPCGSVILRLLPSFTFLCQHNDFFQHHDLSGLPREFVARIGELATCHLERGVMQVLRAVIATVRMANEYVWILTDQIMTPAIPMFGETCRKGVSFKILLPSDLTIPSDEPPLPRSDRVEVRRLEAVEVGIMMSDRDAVLCFADASGKIDFTMGFRSRDPQFHRWCSDYFAHHWNTAKRDATYQHVERVP